ncbi:MAG TPA: lipase family protein [Mycobacterium sp.]|nr:lipase family protein [Mycobacterium sp.]
MSSLPNVAKDAWDGRGQLVHQEPFDDPPLADPEAVLGRAWKAVYRSVSGVDGGMREISGSFFVPSGTPPKGGWPVISLAHGTVGIGNNCGPSRQPDLQGYGFMVKGLLESKYAVALTDYEGLGETGSHPYLEPRTEAFNTIDAVRALRNLTPEASARWIGVGYSQGGQAVWAANELNSYYASDLQLEGSVALAPATNLSGAADLVLSKSMTDEQRALFPTVIVGLARYNPDLDERSFLHESTNAYQKSLSSCQPRRGHSRKVVPAAVPWDTVAWRVRESNDLEPDTPQDVAKLKEVLRRVAIPQGPLKQPMLVISAAHDDVVFPDWVRLAVSRSCELGGEVEYLQADARHDDILWKAFRPVDRWIADRFAGTAAPSNCPPTQG